MDSLVQTVIDAFNTKVPRELIIFIISLLPVLELRGGMLAASALHVNMWKAFFICGIGTLLPIPLILLFIRQILDWLRNTKFVKLVERIEEKANKKSAKVNQYKSLGLFLFVAIPLPGTGAWTGALVAALMKMRFQYAMGSIICGTLAADVIMCLLSYGILGAVW